MSIGLMEPILYLTHRIPFPPNKGDKVVSFNLLKYLASRYRVYLGTFVDDPADLDHVDRLSEYCADVKIVRLQPVLARVRSVTALLHGEPLTVRYYRDAVLARWVRRVVREHRIRKSLVFSSAMAQYVRGMGDLRVVVDFVDVDSAKWEEYARSHRWPLSAIYRREGERLLACEREVAGRAAASVFVTANEAELFRRLAPECAARVHCVQIGVDTEFYAPGPELANPFPPDVEPIVFTGVMNYWPNVDAAHWFAAEVLPLIIAARPRARFYVVGMNPAPSVQALARQAGVVVTGRVPDIRPYLQFARVVVAPLRLARGIQTKVLEAMAMAKPVVVSEAAALALSATAPIDLETAGNARQFAQKTLALMEADRGQRVGTAARARVLADYDWNTNLAPFERLLDHSALVSGVTTDAAIPAHA